jgi:hypothetical protein
VRGAWSSILPSITALVRSIGHRVTVPYNRTLSSGLQGFDFRLQFGSMSTRSFVGLRRHLLKRGLVVPMRNHLLTEWDMGSHADSYGRKFVLHSGHFTDINGTSIIRQSCISL